MSTKYCVVFAVGILLGLTILVSVPNSTAAEIPYAVHHVAIGDYVFQPGSQTSAGRNKFDARSNGSSVTGSFDFKSLIGGTATEVKGTIDCLVVNGNLAAVHGIVTSSVPPNSYPGTDIFWQIISNGGGTPDQSSVPQPGSIQCCVNGFNSCNPPTFNIAVFTLH